MLSVVKKLCCLLPAAFFIQLSAETLRVATYNVRNYTLEHRVIDGKREGNYPKPEKEKEALRTVIRAVNADILALQEIGGDEFTEELRQDLKRDGLDYPHSVTLAGPDEKRRLAVIAKKPFKRVEKFSKIPANFSGKESFVARGLLGVVFENDSGETFTLYVIHLKSRLASDKSDPRAAAQRLAEAGAIRELIAGAGETHVLIAGDFNDAPHSPPLRRFSGTAKNPFFVMLPACDSRGETWTYRNDRDGYYDRSDFIFASPALAKKIPAPACIVDLPATQNASDHRPVVVDLTFEK